MKGFKAIGFALALMMGAFGSIAHAGPVFQANAFQYHALPHTFTVTLNKYANVSGQPMTGANGGGAFKVKSPIVGTSPVQYLLPEFPTFCLEHSESFSYGVQYTATVDKDAIFGTSSTGADPVGGQSQLLYVKFLRGKLDAAVSGFNYSLLSSYTQLQIAFWQLEQENWGGLITAPANALAKALVDYANAHASNNQDYGVRALNLWKKTGCGTGVTCTPYTQAAKAQSQLIWVPEPNTITLLGFALIALAGTVRFLQKNSAVGNK